MGRPSNTHSFFSFDNSWGALWSVWNRITRALSTRETRLRKHTHTEGMRNIYNMQLVSLHKDRSSWQGFLRVWRGKNGFYNAQRLAIRYIPNLSSSSFSKRFPFELPAAGASHSAGVWWKKRIERHVRWRLLLPTILCAADKRKESCCCGCSATAVAAFDYTAKVTTQTLEFGPPRIQYQQKEKTGQFSSYFFFWMLLFLRSAKIRRLDILSSFQ